MTSAAVRRKQQGAQRARPYHFFFAEQLSQNVVRVATKRRARAARHAHAHTRTRHGYSAIDKQCDTGNREMRRHTYTHIHTHTHTHMHTHTYTRIHTRTCAHIHKVQAETGTDSDRERVAPVHEDVTTEGERLGLAVQATRGPSDLQDRVAQAVHHLRRACSTRVRSACPRRHTQRAHGDTRACGCRDSPLSSGSTVIPSTTTTSRWKSCARHGTIAVHSDDR
jgi:hypothetical protein